MLSRMLHDFLIDNSCKKKLEKTKYYDHNVCNVSIAEFLFLSPTRPHTPTSRLIGNIKLNETHSTSCLEHKIGFNANDGSSAGFSSVFFTN